MNRACLLIACITTGLLQPQLLRAEEDPLKLVPKEAFVVVRFSSADQFLGNVKEMLEAVSPIASAFGAEFEEEFYDEFLGVEGGKNSIDRKAPILAAVFPLFDNDEPTAIFVQVKDRDAFRRGLEPGPGDEEFKIERRDDGSEKVTVNGQSYYLAEHGKYTVCTPDEDVARLLSPEHTKMNSLADALPAREKKLFIKGDVAIAVNLAPVVRRYKGDLNDALEEANRAIDGLPDEQLGTASPEATKKFYKQMVKLSFDAALDARWAVASARFNAAGASVDSLLTVKKDSETAELLARNPARSLKNVSLLPAGAPVYAGFAVDNDEWVMNWLRSNYGDNPDNQEAIEAAIKQMQEAENQSTVLSYSLPDDDTTGVVAVTIEDAKDAGKYLDGWRSFMRAIDEVKSPLFTQTVTIKEKAEKYKGHDIDLMLTKIELGDADLTAIVGGMFKRIFGGDTFQSRLTRVDNFVVQATGNDPSTIRKLLDSLESGQSNAGSDAELAKTRDRVDQDANLTVLIDLPRLIVDGVNMFRDVEPLDEGINMLPFNFGVTPPASYTGFSLSTGRQSLQMKLFIPVQQPKGVLQIFGPSL